MESLFDNRPLLYSLAGAGGFVVMLALGKSKKHLDRKGTMNQVQYVDMCVSYSCLCSQSGALSD